MELLLGLGIMLVGLEVYRRVVNTIYRVITKGIKKKKRLETDGAFCLLKISINGELNHQKFTDESKARETYRTTLNFNEGDGSFIGLYDRAVLIESNL